MLYFWSGMGIPPSQLWILRVYSESVKLVIAHLSLKVV